MAETSYRLQEIADALGASLRGDPDARVSGMATLQAAGPGQISFLANPSYGKYLKDTKAGAVIVSPATADQAQTNVLIMDNPYLGYARLSHWFDRTPVAPAGIHATAFIDPSATIAATASIGPHAVVEADVQIGEQVVVGAGSVVGARSRIGDCSILSPRVTLAHDVQLGQRCNILSGAVIGSAGFGFANEKGQWHRIAQLGGVVLGDDVEVGANTTIDRGALEPTVIGDGVKLDNLIQVAHNVQIGDHTAMAALTAIAGSTSIGKYCVFGGASAVAGHLEVADGVHLTGMSMVTNDISEPGVYSSGLPADKNRQWRKNAVRFRQLDGLARRIKELEKKFKG
ncbi:UDP-3-O-(3-hydroxymyristoyl)glucosamine N-acyltransferase [Marinobacter litoralis]|uniref:UDP-3-O-(3-hydroxymyristoyl)glucosamine N-acyltransferase n=1 Tax=Marinobacter litoralis TaxID=187981 RepID=UPI0018EB5382|nr:UDP-3-O-(3-hydroxymyristoyl)glucosamine N-acyltransferase [Marinobacter litoralis]MBJ6138823.1 UDP-3-O-(3-hydroxymyristoyl)glucosamine N-acyltransferase [Marinobacter litoralis]